MTGQQKLLSLWVCLLLVATLCPVNSKRGGIFKGRGKSNGSKGPPSQSQGLPKQGLKLAGAAAAAGVLGGTGTGYRLGLTGRAKHGSGSHNSHKTSSEQDQKLYYEEQGMYQNKSLWMVTVSAAPAPNIFLTLGHVVSFLIAAWITQM